MKKYLIKNFTLFSLISFILSCSTAPPAWVDTHPQDKQYWHGVGFASHSNGEFTKALAKEYAIHEISSQIKVNISSEMDIVVTDFNGSVDNVISSVMKSRSDLILPELEFIGQYKTKRGLYFYVKLNKVKYNAAMVRLRANARETALDYIIEADHNFGVRSLKLIQKAWKEILPFNDEPIEVIYDSQTTHLYPLIKRKLFEFQDRIELEAMIDNETIRTFVDRENSIRIKVKDKENSRSISGVPVKVTVRNDESTFYSESDGLIRYNFSGLSSVSTLRLQFFLDYSELFKGLNEIDHTLDLKPRINAVVLKIIPARATIESSEKNLNKEIKEPIILKRITESLSNRIEFVKSKPDMIIRIDANTAKRSERAGNNFPYFSYGSASIAFVDASTNEQFFSSVVSDVKGADFYSQETAGIRSYEKMVVKLISELENSFNDTYENN